MTNRAFFPKRAGLALAAALAVGGCAGGHPLGPTDGGEAGNGPPSSDRGGTTGAAGTTATAGSTGTAGAAGAPVIIALGGSESWTGYVENYMFPSGSDGLALTFGIDPTGAVVGSLVFGKGTPPPPATDPNVGYPANYFMQSGPTGFSTPDFVAEGYFYQLDPGTLTASRLRFTVFLQQLWTGWCGLQTMADGSGFCRPNWPSMVNVAADECNLIDPATMKSVPIDCGKYALCGPASPCECSAPGPCGISKAFGGVTFDVSLSGATASGSITGSLGDHNVHLTKN